MNLAWQIGEFRSQFQPLSFQNSFRLHWQKHSLDGVSKHNKIKRYNSQLPKCTNCFLPLLNGSWCTSLKINLYQAMAKSISFLIIDSESIAFVLFQANTISQYLIRWNVFNFFEIFESPLLLHVNVNPILTRRTPISFIKNN